MTFRITKHAGYDAPADAVDQLLGHLQGQPNGRRFHKIGSEIRVAWGNDESRGWGRPERLELEREELLNLLQRTCTGSGDLKVDWYAIAALD